MRDRVVQHPNRYKLTPVSGDVYDLTPEPGIVTEEGTDLNKANLLSDSTELKILNATNDATVDDALSLLGERKQKKLIATFTSSGTFNIADYNLEIGSKIDAYIVGGGGSGCGYFSTGRGGGGGGGYCKLIRDFVLTELSYPIVVGAGGASVVGNGLDGGATSAFGTTMPGGKGGTRLKGGDGGSGGGAGGGSNFGPGGSHGGAGGYATTYTSCGNGGGNIDYDPVNPYDNIPYGCGGGGPISPGGGAGGRGSRSSSDVGPELDGSLGGGGGGGIGGSSSGSGRCAGNGGLGGGGGGAAPASGDNTIQGGAGGSGIVYIYA